VITAVHTLVYAEDADAARAFFRDVLELPYVDAHDGWLIFRSPPGELAVHPGDAPGHELSLVCDDVDATVRELAARGVEVLGPVEERRFGRLARIRVPGAGELTVYEPSHPTAYDLPDPA
jgi:catechol 2,3-dioxygenase-like lactoylglutathione lyase family enzyme